MAETARIGVSRQTRDHLAQVAKEQGKSLRQLVEELAAQQLTSDQIAERVTATRKMLRERVGSTLTDVEFDTGQHILAYLSAVAAREASTP
jgi:heme oxygenase